MSPKTENHEGAEDAEGTESEADETAGADPADAPAADLPTTDELATELNELEEAAETSTEETAPDKPAEPADGTDPPDDGTDPAESETEAPPDRTIAPPVRTDGADPQAAATPEGEHLPDDVGPRGSGSEDDAQPVGRGDSFKAGDKTVIPVQDQARPTSHKDKKAADKKRRDAAIAARPDVDMSDVEAEDERKAEIFELLAEVDDEEEAAQAVVDECHEKTRELMGELYPHTIKSDRLVDAVRGHIAAQKKIRAHRATNPERLKELLKQAGKAPIDAAFHVQRARGMARPKGPGRVPTAKPPEKKNEGDGSNANAGQE